MIRFFVKLFETTTGDVTKVVQTLNMANSTKIKKQEILQLGAKGFIEKGASSQAIFGGKASIIANKINEST